MARIGGGLAGRSAICHVPGGKHKLAWVEAVGTSSGLIYESSAFGIDAGGAVGADIVLLAGDVGSNTTGAFAPSRALLPLLDGTVLDSLLARLGATAWSSCTICANGHTELLRRSTSLPQGMRLSPRFFADASPLGPAGCLHACMPSLHGNAVFVAGAATWLEEDPAWMLQQHRANGNALTVYCNNDMNRALPSGRAVLQHCGVYCVEREALNSVRSSGFLDIKEQLIPALRTAGLRVGAVRVRSAAFPVTDWSSYMRALTHSCAAQPAPSTAYRREGPSVWTGRNVHVATSARLMGSVILGDDCLIENGASLIGPIILGSGCHVEEGATLVRVIAPQKTRFDADSFVNDRFFGTDTGLGAGGSGRPSRAEGTPSSVGMRSSRSLRRCSNAG